MTDNSDRRALLAIILSLGVYFVWSAFFAPPPPVGPPAEPPAPIAAEPDAAGTTAGPATASAPAVTPGLAAPEPDIPEHAEDLTTASWGAQVSSRGGALGEVALADFRKPKVVVPLWEWGLARVTGKAESGWEPYTGGEDPYGLLEGGGLGLAGAGDLADSGNFQVTRSGDVVTAQRRRADGLVITTTYTPGEGPYSLDVTVQYDNGTGKPVGDLWVGVAEPMSGEAGRFLNAVRPLVHSDGDVEHVEDLEDLDGSANERFEGPIQWYGVGDRYFMAVLVPDADPGAVVMVPPDDAPARWSSRRRSTRAPRDEVSSHLSRDLDLLKPLGSTSLTPPARHLRGLLKLLLFLLELFQGFVVNWGVAIILLTFLVKLAFFPLTGAPEQPQDAGAAAAAQRHAGEVQGQPAAPDRRDDEALQGAWGEPTGRLPAHPHPAARLVRAVQHHALQR